jgi:hypothetical protein
MEPCDARCHCKNEWAPVHESIAGPDIFVIGEGFLVDTSVVSGSGSAWPWRSSPADMFELLKAQRGWQLLMTSTAPRPCDEQGHQSDPVASCSSSRVGRRTFVRIRCVSSRSSHRGANACEVGATRSVTPTGAAPKCCGRCRPVSSRPRQQAARPVPGNIVRASSGGSRVGRGRGS